MAEQNSSANNHDDLYLSVPFLTDHEHMSSYTPQPAARPAVPTASTSIPPSSTSPPRTSSTLPRSFSFSLNPSAPSAPSSTHSSGLSGTIRMVPRIPSDETRAFSRPNNASPGGSMILYRFVNTSFFSPPSANVLTPPQPSHLHRSSMYSTSGESIRSDSKYPVMSQTERGLVAYAYDPDVDEKAPLDEEDMMHDPTLRYHHNLRTNGKSAGMLNSRALLNLSTLMAMVIAIVLLFVGYPAIAFYRDNGRHMLIVENPLINATGQLP